MIIKKTVALDIITNDWYQKNAEYLFKTNFFNVNLSRKYYLDAIQPITAVLTVNFQAWVPHWPQCALVFDWSRGVMADSNRHGRTDWKQNLIIWQIYIYWLSVENARTQWYYSVNRVTRIRTGSKVKPIHHWLTA